VPSRRGLQESLDRLAELQRALAQAVRSEAEAIRRGWHVAADHQRRRCRGTLRQIASQAEAALRVEAAEAPISPACSVRDLLAELRSLEAEFPDEPVSVDLRQGVLAVTTEPIALEEIRLGRFRIELRLTELRHGLPGGTAFRCVALSPNPASACSATTHPHVRDDQPCLGEATAPVQMALAEGRLCDGFLAVAAVLRTYNRGSPFVALEEWHGRSCSDCGDYASDDNLNVCGACEQEVCDHCCGRCDGCDASVCHSCLDRSADGDRLCPDCRGCCRTCRGVVLTRELEEHDDRCSECAAADDAAETRDAAETDDAVQDDADDPAIASPSDPLPETPPAQLPLPAAQVAGFPACSATEAAAR
jgi:hypothetical protein